MRGPDVVPPVSTMGEIESRMGLPPLEALLAERDTLVKQVAILRATHGPFGTYEALRKMQLASIGAILRAKAVEAGVRITEAAIDEGSQQSSGLSDLRDAGDTGESRVDCGGEPDYRDQ